MYVMSLDRVIPARLPAAQIDNEATAIARAHQSGEVDYATAMTWLGRLIVLSTIPHEEMVTRLRSGALRREDAVTAEDQLRDMLCDKLDPAPGDTRVRAEVDFKLLAGGSSFSAWMRSFSGALLDRTIIRGVGRYRAKNMLSLTGSLADAAGSDYVTDEDAGRADDELHVLHRQLRGASEGASVIARSTSLLRYRQLPEPRRPVTEDGRRQVREAIKAGTLAQYLRSGHTGPVQDLFADFTAEQVGDLDALSLELLAELAITPLPAISRTVRRELVAWAAAQVPCEHAAAARAVTDAWLTQRTEITGGREGPVEVKPDQQRLQERSDFWTAASVLLDSFCYELGETIDEIATALRERYFTIERERFLSAPGAAPRSQTTA